MMLRYSIILLLALSNRVEATQYLVAPGDSWSDLAGQLKPGDEVILLPGQHRDVVLIGIKGTQEAQVIIRGADTSNISLIQARRVGIHLRDCRFVEIRDLTITGARINGIRLDHEKEVKRTVEDRITIRNVIITQTGTRGKRHAINLLGQQGIVIDQCTIEGWGGSGINVEGGSDILITHSTLRGMKTHSQQAGVSIRNEAAGVRIDRCRLVNCGEYAIQIGDIEEAEYRFAAKEVDIENNVIIGGKGFIFLSKAVQVLIRRNTIVNPEYTVISVLRHASEGDSPVLKGVLMRSNIITWDGKSSVRLFATLRPEPLARKVFSMEVNLWWSEEDEDKRLARIDFPLEDHAVQVWKINPRLDEKYRVQAREAGLYGVPQD